LAQAILVQAPVLPVAPFPHLAGSMASSAWAILALALVGALPAPAVATGHSLEIGHLLPSSLPTMPALNLSHLAAALPTLPPVNLSRLPPLPTAHPLNLSKLPTMPPLNLPKLKPLLGEGGAGPAAQRLDAAAKAAARALPTLPPMGVSKLRSRLGALGKAAAAKVGEEAGKLPSAQAKFDARAALGTASASWALGAGVWVAAALAAAAIAAGAALAHRRLRGPGAAGGRVLVAEGGYLAAE